MYVLFPKYFKADLQHFAKHFYPIIVVFSFLLLRKRGSPSGRSVAGFCSDAGLGQLLLEWLAG